MIKKILFFESIALVLSLLIFTAASGADYKYDYYDYEEMVDLLLDLETEALTKSLNVYNLQVIGHSYQGNPIYAVKFSDNPETEEDIEPDVVFDSGIHSNEWIAVESNINFIRYLFNAYYAEEDPDHQEVVDLINDFEIWIIPMINVDGRIRDDLNGGDPESFWTDTTYHDSDTGGWRMNVQEVACPSRPDGKNLGIDLNRTFSNNFWELSDCEIPIYNGGTPFAAHESKVLKQFINNHMVALLLHQHSNIHLLFSASQTEGLGAYITEEMDAIYDDGLINPLLALTNEIELRAGNRNWGNRSFNAGGIIPLASGACDGHRFSGQFYDWLWSEIDCILSPDVHSRRTIQSIFYEYPVDDEIYGVIEDGNVGQFARGDASNGFHPSSGETVEWIINKSVQINKYLIRQSRYPFSPRFYADMSKRPEAPEVDLAIVGSKISRARKGLPGSFGFDETDGIDLLEPGRHRVTWNVQNNGNTGRTIASGISICDLTVDPGCANPTIAVLSAKEVPPETVETFTYEFTFEPNRNYSATITTGETDNYDNDLKRYVFRTTAASAVCPAVLISDKNPEKIRLLREFRDKLLLKKPFTKKYVPLFYQHFKDLTMILEKNPLIKQKSQEILNCLLPAIKALISGHGTTLSPSAINKINDLCDLISTTASSGLRKTIENLQRDIKKGKLLRFFELQ